MALPESHLDAPTQPVAPVPGLEIERDRTTMPDDETSSEVTPDTPIDKVRDAYNRSVKREKELSDQVTEFKTVQRENAMLRAGVDLSTPLGTLFMNGYAGELDVDAIKTAWGGLPTGAPSAPPTDTTEEPDAEALRRQEERERLQNGSVAPGSEPPADPVETAYKVFHENIKKGMSRDRAMPTSLDIMLKAAMDGDERMLYDADRWRATH